MYVIFCAQLNKTITKLVQSVISELKVFMLKKKKSIFASTNFSHIGHQKENLLQRFLLLIQHLDISAHENHYTLENSVASTLAFTQIVATFET